MRSVSVLARVMSGWTGVLTLAGVNITPRRRESVGSLWCRAVRDVYAQTGTQLTLDPFGVFVSADSAFSWSASGNIYSRSGFSSSSYSGAVSYSRDTSFTGQLSSRYGARVEATLQSNKLGPVADGASAPGPRSTETRAVIKAHWRATGPSFFEISENDANLVLAGLDSTSNVFDVWHVNRVVARCRINSVRRMPATNDRGSTTSIMAVELDTTLVLE